MSVDQRRRDLNQIDSEIVKIEKDNATLTKSSADKIKKISDIKNSITKNTPISSTQSKFRQIETLNSELARISTKQAELSKKMADKRKKRADISIKLQNEEIAEQKKIEKAQKVTLLSYEQRINDLTEQLSAAVGTQISQAHLYATNNNEEFDVFISHASDDKTSIVEELAQTLISADIKVWYDSIDISWGDSLRSKIDNGLKKSRFGIVIISKDYIKKGWTNYELDGLFEKEMLNGKTILPIWHNISKKEVADFSPTLAGRLALNSALLTPKEIANELIKQLELAKKEN